MRKPLAALLGLSLVLSCASPSDIGSTASPQLVLHISSDVASRIETVGVAIDYLRTSGAPVGVLAETFQIASAGETLSVDVDITRCLGDPGHLGATGECRVTLTVTVLSASDTTMARQSVGPLSLRAGQVTTVPPLTFVLTPPPIPSVPVATVTLTPDSVSLVVADTATFSAQARDSAGTVLQGRAVLWSIDNAAVATVDTSGTVTAVAAGAAQVFAVVEGVSDSAIVRVSPIPSVPVATVTLTPDSVSLVVADTATFSAQARDSAGTVLQGRAVLWSIDDTAVATVDTSGTVTAVAAGAAQIFAVIEGVSDSAIVRVSPPQPSLVGSWWTGDPTAVDLGVLVVLDDTTYMLPGDGVPDLDGQPGVEYGSFVWANNGTRFGVLTANPTTDTDGGWGLSGIIGTGTVQLDATGDTAIFLDSADPPAVPLYRLKPSLTNPLIGTWVFDSPTNPARVLTITFVDATTYVLGIVDPPNGSGGSGMERGTYTWNSGTGAFGAAASRDTNGDRPLSPLFNSGTATVSADTLRYVSTGGTLTGIRHR